jgi:hypothetical protein
MLFLVLVVLVPCVNPVLYTPPVISLLTAPAGHVVAPRSCVVWG